MSEPFVCGILLAWNNPHFTERAKRYWESQTYTCRHLIVLHVDKECTVGMRRNRAIQMVPGNTEYIAHVDHDDISAPDRLTRQLEHIQKTGKLVTGFYDMPMYDAKNDKVWIYSDPAKRYILGTSLFYKREAWERVKFPDRTPEDNLWRKQVGGENCEPQSVFREDGTPMMVQTVHGGNASARIVANSARFKEAGMDLDKEVRRILKNA